MNSLPPFGIIIPGQPALYNFEQIGEHGVLTIQNPKSINVLSFFMNQPLGGADMGAALYYSTPPNYQNLIFIGAIANARPSDIFHPGFALNPDVNVHREIKLVIQLKNLSEIETNVLIAQETDLQKDYAKKVAHNLFNYLKSFDNQKSGNTMVVPVNSLEKWFEKFTRKYDMDPNFVYKTQE